MSARILIVEDNPANLELMTYLLKAYGHILFVAVDGDEGLSVARRENPDLIVCDIQLPGTDGYAVARALKADLVLHGTPLIAVTAFAMVGDRDKVLAAGFDGYIAKPIDPESFMPVVDGFLPQDKRSNPPTPALATDSTPAASAARAVILAVDDLPVNLSLKRSILEPLGYSVITAKTMTGALELARQTIPDLIVSDVGMVDGSGYDFIQNVKADPRLKDIPFIFVTSTHCDSASRARGLALGAARFLFRPLEPEQLLAEIEACLRERTKS